MIFIDHKYIRLISSQLDLFKQKNDELYNFRCPICGDSQKNVHKARGYVFRKKESLIYKCHNCGDSRSLGSLIKNIDPTMYSQYVMERYKSKENNKLAKSIPKFEFAPPVFPKHSPGKMLDRIGAVRLDSLPDDHIANRFVESRKLPCDKTRGLYYIDDEEKLEELSPKYKNRIVGHAARLLLPFCDRSGNITGLTGRLIGDKGLRYLTLKFNGDTEPLIFGMENLDVHRNITVVEGPLDSLFLVNCIAVGGSDFGKLDGLVSRENATIVFDNEPRNKEIVARMQTLINDNWHICIWPDKIFEKDINDMVIAGQTSSEIQNVINRNKVFGLQAKFKLNEWKKI